MLHSNRKNHIFLDTPISILFGGGYFGSWLGRFKRWVISSSGCSRGKGKSCMGFFLELTIVISQYFSSLGLLHITQMKVRYCEERKNSKKLHQFKTTTRIHNTTPVKGGGGEGGSNNANSQYNPCIFLHTTVSV